MITLQYHSHVMQCEFTVKPMKNTCTQNLRLSGIGRCGEPKSKFCRFNSKRIPLYCTIIKCTIYSVGYRLFKLDNRLFTDYRIEHKFKPIDVVGLISWEQKVAIIS